jgi:hypothetical protein
VHREQGDKGRWRTRIEVFDSLQPDATRPAFGATRENSASPQVPPNAGRPAAGGPAPKKKYKTSSRGQAREEVKAEPPYSAPPCPICGEPFSQDLLADPDFRAMAMDGGVVHDGKCAEIEWAGEA